MMRLLNICMKLNFLVDLKVDMLIIGFSFFKFKGRMLSYDVFCFLMMMICLYDDIIMYFYFIVCSN